MCDIFKRIHNTVSIIITGIDTPLVSGMRMGRKLKAQSINTIRFYGPITITNIFGCVLTLIRYAMRSYIL